MTENDLKKLKQIELDLFKEFLRICNKYSIRYFIIGGTCLGAVRHKGFIPWDDDIDVGLPRKDYERFLAVAQQELPDNMFLQTHNTDPEYIINFAKIRNSDTTFIEKSVKDFRINHGVYIDVFPLDGYPKGRLSEEVFRFKKIIYSYAINESLGISGNPKGILKKIFKKIILLLYSDVDKNVKRKEDLYSRYDYEKSEMIANYGGAWGKKEIVPLSYFGKGVQGKFEGIDVVIPENYDGYLTALYGEYMTPPPVEKQVGHHYCEIIDLDKPYTIYRK